MANGRYEMGIAFDAIGSNNNIEMKKTTDSRAIHMK